MDALAMIGQAISSIGGGSANYMQYAQMPQQQQNYGQLMYNPQMGYQYSLGSPGNSWTPGAGSNAGWEY